MAHHVPCLTWFKSFRTGRVAVLISVLVIFIFCAADYSTNISSLDLKKNRASLMSHKLLLASLRPLKRKTVVVCMSICGSNGPEALISVKSALLQKSNQHEYEFHFFTDESERVKKDLIDEMLLVGKGKPMENVALVFHTIKLTKMQYLFKLCAANRLLMPIELDQAIDEYIYVDSDTLWLEDPANLMEEFSWFNSDNEIGMTYEVETSEKIGWYHTQPQINRTFYGPTGLNSGVGIYRIHDRNTTWNAFEKVVQEHEGNLPLGDQDVLNAYLARHPLKFYKLACHWNRRPDSRCLSSTRGILHGNRRAFHQPLKPSDEYVLRWTLVKALPFEGFSVEDSQLPTSPPQEERSSNASADARNNTKTS